MNAQTIDPKSFRNALSHFPTGVTVITTRTETGEPIGVTASSFNSVSMDPPLVLWSVDKGAYSADIFKNTSHFCVNILAQDQIDISGRFAGRGEDKFGGILTEDGLGGVPLINGCVAQFQCANWNAYDGGDHYILVGEVKDFTVDETASPLVFTCGYYAVSEPHPAMQATSSEAGDENGFIDSYLLYVLRQITFRLSSSLYPKLMKSGNVKPEEWRVLTMLGDRGPMSVHQLSDAVMQPVAALRDSLAVLCKHGLVIQDAADHAAVTEKGQKITQQLVKIAKGHEAELLSDLPVKETKLLKKILHAMMKKLPAS